MGRNTMRSSVNNAMRQRLFTEYLNEQKESTMKEYQIEVVETFTKVIKVTASNEYWASRIVKDMYMDDEIILEKSDLKGIEFNNK